MGTNMPTPRGYRIIAISLYDRDAATADRFTEILQRGGWPKANRSLVMREALIRLEEELAAMSPEEVFQFFANRLAKRAGAVPAARLAPSTQSPPDPMLHSHPRRA